MSKVGLLSCPHKHILVERYLMTSAHLTLTDVYDAPNNEGHRKQQKMETKQFHLNCLCFWLQVEFCSSFGHFE